MLKIISLFQKIKKERHLSVDDNIFHTSTEGKVLENPKNSAPEFIYQRTISPEKAPNKKTRIKITFKKR